MKYFALLVVAFAALAPALVYAQSQQFSDCRTVENAGNPRKLRERIGRMRGHNEQPRPKKATWKRGSAVRKSSG